MDINAINERIRLDEHGGEQRISIIRLILTGLIMIMTVATAVTRYMEVGMWIPWPIYASTGFFLLYGVYLFFYVRKTERLSDNFKYICTFIDMTLIGAMIWISFTYPEISHPLPFLSFRAIFYPVFILAGAWRYSAKCAHFSGIYASITYGIIIFANREVLGLPLYIEFGGELEPISFAVRNEFFRIVGIMLTSTITGLASKRRLDLFYSLLEAEGDLRREMDEAGKKHLEDIVRESDRLNAIVKEKMQAILDSSPLLCAHYDENVRLLEANKEAEHMFGIPDKRMFVDNPSKYTPKTQPDGSDSDQKTAAMAARAMEEGSVRYEWAYLHNDGSLIPTEEIMHRISIEGKYHLMVYSRDLREHHREREKERIVQGKIQSMLEQLNEHVEKQTASVAASSSATEEMIANIRSVTDTLSKNARNVKDLQDASEAGHSSLNQVVADIQGIARESESLLEINSVMQNIASQTNLLSMNAAIEAAHAGDAGRGFAVVADEIRKLAESSSKQSKTIGGVLKSIKGSIDGITKSTGVVLDKFDAIGDGVRTVSEQEDSILNSMEEQGEGSKQILQSVGTVNELTHQVRESARRMVETTKEAMHKTNDLEARAFTDDLTGVRNREYFTEAAEQELRYCVNEGRDFNLIAFSLDNLRRYEGTSTKEDILKVLTMRVRNSFKQGTLLARYSDDLFLVTLPNTSFATAQKLAEQIQRKVKEAPFAIKGQRLGVSISVGVASKTATARTLLDIVGNAERALSSTQAAGASKVVSV